MAPSNIIRTNDIEKTEYSEKAAIGALYDELSKGIDSMRKGDVYTILDTFKYREYAENFSKKIKKAIKELDSFLKGYEPTGYVIEGLSIYFKPYSTYLIFFVFLVLHG